MDGREETLKMSFLLLFHVSAASSVFFRVRPWLILLLLLLFRVFASAASVFFRVIPWLILLLLLFRRLRFRL